MTSYKVAYTIVEYILCMKSNGEVLSRKLHIKAINMHRFYLNLYYDN